MDEHLHPSRDPQRHRAAPGDARQRFVRGAEHEGLGAGLDDDGAYSALPGGIHGSRFSDSYDRWLEDYRAGRYHRIEPPDDGEDPL